MMPMPNPMAGGPPPAPSDGGKPKDIRSTLIKILQEAKKVAEQNGIDFAELVSSVLEDKGSAAPPPPPL